MPLALPTGLSCRHGWKMGRLPHRTLFQSEIWTRCLPWMRWSSANRDWGAIPLVPLKQELLSNMGRIGWMQCALLMPLPSLFLHTRPPPLPQNAVLASFVWQCISMPPGRSRRQCLLARKWHTASWPNSMSPAVATFVPVLCSYARIAQQTQARIVCLLQMRRRSEACFLAFSKGDAEACCADRLVAGLSWVRQRAGSN